MSKEIENEPRGRYDWKKVATRCGTVGFLLMLVISGASVGHEGSGAVEFALFIIFPAMLLSTVAVIIGLWTRASLGWFLGLLAFAWMLAQRYLRGG